MAKPAPTSRPLPESMPLPLRLERTAPMRANVMELFIFDSLLLGRIEVEAGFDTDYASVPRALWSLYPPDGDYTPAAVIHDALYWHQATKESGGMPVNRAQADAAFLEAMEDMGIPLLRRRTLYRAVRMGGAAAWRKNQRMNPLLTEAVKPKPQARRRSPARKS